MKINEEKTRACKKIQDALMDYDLGDKLDILIQITTRLWIIACKNDKETLMDIIDHCYDDIEEHVNLCGGLKDDW